MSAIESVGATAASIRKMLDGMCVNTIVLMRPMRRDSEAATGNEKADRIPDQAKNRAAAVSDMSKRSNNQSAKERLHHEATGKGVEAEQGGELVDDMTRGSERCHRPFLRQSRAGGNARVDEGAREAEERI